MIRIDKNFIRAFSPNEQLIMLRLVLNADENGVTEFSDRTISKETEIPYQKVRTIHQKFLSDGIITNTSDNAVNNANKCFVTICDFDSYNVFNIFSNAVLNALKKQEIRKEIEKFLSQTLSFIDKENNKEEKIPPLLSPPTGEVDELRKRIADLETANASLMEENEKLKDDGSSKFDLSVIDPVFLPIVKDWLKYKKSKRQVYKNQDSFMRMYERLLKLSGNNPQKAQEVVEQSISNNYDGLFAVKQNSQHNGLLVGQLLTDSKEERDRKFKGTTGWR